MTLCDADDVVCYTLLSLQIGTYQMAVMAKALNKPFYVVAESFKFVRMYPLNQGDLPNVEKVTTPAHIGNRSSTCFVIPCIEHHFYHYFSLVYP